MQLVLPDGTKEDLHLDRPPRRNPNLLWVLGGLKDTRSSAMTAMIASHPNLAGFQLPNNTDRRTRSLEAVSAACSATVIEQVQAAACAADIPVHGNPSKASHDSAGNTPPHPASEAAPAEPIQDDKKGDVLRDQEPILASFTQIRARSQPLRTARSQIHGAEVQCSPADHANVANQRGQVALPNKHASLAPIENSPRSPDSNRLRSQFPHTEAGGAVVTAPLNTVPATSPTFSEAPVSGGSQGDENHRRASSAGGRRKTAAGRGRNRGVPANDPVGPPAWKRPKCPGSWEEMVTAMRDAEAAARASHMAEWRRRHSVPTQQFADTLLPHCQHALATVQDVALEVECLRKENENRLKNMLHAISEVLVAGGATESLERDILWLVSAMATANGVCMEDLLRKSVSAGAYMASMCNEVEHVATGKGPQGDAADSRAVAAGTMYPPACCAGNSKSVAAGVHDAVAMPDINSDPQEQAGMGFTQRG